MLSSLRVSNRIAIAEFSMSLLGGMAVAPLGASEWDKSTIITFNSPVEVPGKVLLPGTYVFETLPDDRNVVLIFDRDSNKLEEITFAIPTYASTVPSKPMVQFEERIANAPQAIKAWFYPGDATGFEFIYPRASQAGAGISTGSENSAHSVGD